MEQSVHAAAEALNAQPAIERGGLAVDRKALDDAKQKTARRASALLLVLLLLLFSRRSVFYSSRSRHGSTARLLLGCVVRYMCQSADPTAVLCCTRKWQG